MKRPRFSLKVLLGAIAVVAIVLALDQNLESKTHEIRNKIQLDPKSEFGSNVALDGETYANDGMEATYGKPGELVIDETTVFDRLLLRRRLVVGYAIVVKPHGTIGFNLWHRRYVLTVFATTREDKIGP